MRQRGEVGPTLESKTAWITQLEGRVVGGYFEPADTTRADGSSTIALTLLSLAGSPSATLSTSQVLPA